MREQTSHRIRTALQERIGVSPTVYDENDNLVFSYDGIGGRTSINIRDFDAEVDQPVDSTGIKGGKGMLIVTTSTDTEDYPHRHFDATLDIPALIEHVVEAYNDTRQQSGIG